MDYKSSPDEKFFNLEIDVVLPVLIVITGHRRIADIIWILELDKVSPEEKHPRASWLTPFMESPMFRYTSENLLRRDATEL